MKTDIDDYIFVDSYVHWRTGKRVYRKNGGKFRIPVRRKKK